MNLRVQRLTAEHDRASFDCGNERLSSWFHQIAGQADRRHSARVFVLVDLEEDPFKPMGYYTLTAHGIAFDELTQEQTKGQPRHLPVGAALIGRLAMDVHHQGQGLGTALLRHAAEQVIAADEHVATPLVVVDAIDEDAVRFYERHGFRRLPDTEGRLVARTIDLAEGLGL